MHRDENLRQFARTEFDYIIIDEAHRAGAATYQKIINHFTPKFLLGLSATPERTDNFNIYELFDYNVPYEIRLRKALEESMLVPFHYYGITDYQGGGGITANTPTELLVSDERVAYIVEKLQQYSRTEGVRGLIFCSRNEEAELLSEKLNAAQVYGKTLRTMALSGAHTIEEREDAVVKLQRGELDYLLTVNIFNEGVDIPEVNQVVLLRPTQSAIIFTQQLGRGLRKAAGKDHLRVIDFIGNYDNNFLIPVALTGRMEKGENSHSVRNPQGIGSSTINFDEIASHKILNAIENHTYTGIKVFREEILPLRTRLNKIPRLQDLLVHTIRNPYTYVSTVSGVKNYWELLYRLKLVDEKPAGQVKNYLDFLNYELLNGQRPHELLILQLLLENPTDSLTFDEIQKLLEQRGTTSDSETVTSAIRVLTLDFYTGDDRKRYGNICFADYVDGVVKLNQDFLDLYNSYGEYNFRNDSWATFFPAHVIDAIETGLRICRNDGKWMGRLVTGERYTRKDYCRVANWKTNHSSVINGYKVDNKTQQCPIFVTHRKKSTIGESTNYADEFLSREVMLWYTRWPRNLESPEIKEVLDDANTLQLFVKYNDQIDGAYFHYLGEVIPANAQNSTMMVQGKKRPVVKMELELKTAVDAGIYKYLTDRRD